MAPAANTKLPLSDLMPSVNHVPSNYSRPISDCPNLQDVDQSSDGSIPLIDLHGLNGSNHSHIIDQIGHACEKDGFFQVKNHGIPVEVIENMLQISKEFFQLPESERLKSYSDDPTKTTRLSTSFNVKTEKVSNWGDFSRLHCYPVEDYINEWPKNPSQFSDGVAEYCRNVRGLTLKLLEAISESLGLRRDYASEVLNKHGQHMSINYYQLPCPETELTYGLPGHTNAITVLLQDEIPDDLQVLRNAKRIIVHPIPNTFIVNIGEQLIQLLSNDHVEPISNSCNLHFVDESLNCSVPLIRLQSLNGSNCDGSFQEEINDRKESLQPITNHDSGNIITSFFKQHEIGKMAMAGVPPAMLTLLMNKKMFPTLALHLVINTLSIGFVLIWYGLMFRNLFQRFACWAEQVGVVIVFLSFFLLVGSVLPPHLVWAPILCATLFLLPFILHCFPSYKKQTDGSGTA